MIPFGKVKGNSQTVPYGYNKATGPPAIRYLLNNTSLTTIDFTPLYTKDGPLTSLTFNHSVKGESQPTHFGPLATKDLEKGTFSLETFGAMEGADVYFDGNTIQAINFLGATGGMCNCGSAD